MVIPGERKREPIRDDAPDCKFHEDHLPTRIVNQRFHSCCQYRTDQISQRVLMNVKLVAANNRIVLTATDMEVGIRLDVEEGIEVEGEGTAFSGSADHGDSSGKQ